MNADATAFEEPEPHPGRWIGLAILLVAGFMNLIDVTIVNVALPRLQEGLGATSSQIEWVAAAYVLAFALGLLPFGRLGDALGRKRMFLLGVAGFTLCSAFCGLAPSMPWLILARVLQGLSAAMMMPQVMAITQVMFPPHERGLAFSFFGLSAGLASVAGPLTGGVLINADLWGLDWRPIFLVNIPVGILTVAAGAALIPDLPAHKGLRLDIGGVFIAGISIVLLAFPLVEGHIYGWPAWSFAMIALSIVGFALFVLHERRREKFGKSELLPVSLLTNPRFVLGIGTVLVFFSGVAGFFLVLAVFLQTGFGFTPLESGLTTVPFPCGVLIASLVSGRLSNRSPRLRLAGGALALLVGMYLLRLRVGEVGDAVDHWRFVLPLAISGLGLGVGISAMFQSVLAMVPPRDAGAGSGALQSFQQIGGALGIALMGQIFFSTLNAGMASDAGAHPAFVDAMKAALVYELAAFALVALSCLFMKRPPRQQRAPNAADAPAQPVPAEL